jgi:hypothetical protein
MAKYVIEFSQGGSPAKCVHCGANVYEDTTHYRDVQSGALHIHTNYSPCNCPDQAGRETSAPYGAESDKGAALDGRSR